MKSSSKRALKKNIATEIEAHPEDRKRDLAIAFSVQRKAKSKKMADGGKADRLRQGAQEARKYDSQKSEKGINTPRFPYPHNKESMGESQAGYYGKATSGVEARTRKPVSDEGMKTASKEEHRKTLEEMRSMPKPKIQGLAEGGMVNKSAKTENRPMLDERDNDAVMASHNEARKALKDSDWTGQPTVKQAQSNNGRKVLPIKVPRMVPSNAFSVRLRDEEADLQDSDRPGPYGEQPPEHDNEMDAKKSGNKVRDMQDEHSTHRKPYAKGGEVESSDYDHPLDGKYEDDLTDLPPSEDEGLSMADSDDEEGQDRQGPAVSDMEDEHSNGRKPYAKGGMAHEMDMQPEPEQEEEHHNSIAAAIMANRDRMHAEIDSGAHDLDRAAKMASGGTVASGSEDMNLAEGGKTNGMDSIYSDDSDQADLKRNAEEDANMEDQSSFDSLRKENYSESAGLKQLDNPSDSAQTGDDREDETEDAHDMISQIRSKMKAKRQFKAR